MATAASRSARRAARRDGSGSVAVAVDLRFTWNTQPTAFGVEAGWAAAGWAADSAAVDEVAG
jgi:hypothetical protein